MFKSNPRPSLAQWTFHSREHLVLLPPGRCGLRLHALFYADEVRPWTSSVPKSKWVAPRELKLAALLVESLVARFEPG